MVKKTSTSSAIEKQSHRNLSRESKKAQTGENLRINITVHGQPALQAKELKELGFVRSNADLVSQAVTVFYQQVIDQRLKALRLKTLERTQENDL